MDKTIKDQVPDNLKNKLSENIEDNKKLNENASNELKELENKGTKKYNYYII